VLHYSRLEILVRDKQSSLINPFVSYKKIKYFEYRPRGRIHNFSFSSQLTNWPNKLDCYITVGWKFLSRTNSLAYWSPFMSYKKMKCFEYGPRGRIHNFSFSSQITNWPNKLDCYITVGWKCLSGTNALIY
jgi:hypothetical protein